jgi:hypothetical protein
MTISIITPSYGQLEWLRLCVASVADQNAPEAQGAESMVDSRTSMARGADTPAAQGIHDGTQSPISNLPATTQSPLAIEHIIQDAGTPGIEEFAREVGEELISRYGGELVTTLQTFKHMICIRLHAPYPQLRGCWISPTASSCWVPACYKPASVITQR